MRTADVSSERAMILSGSTAPKVHARYVATTKAMRALPDAALPRLACQAPGNVRAPDDSSRAPTNSSTISERETGFEPATLSLGSCMRPVSARIHWAA